MMRGPASGVGTIVVEHPTKPPPNVHSVQAMKAPASTVDASGIASAMAFIGLLLSPPKDQIGLSVIRPARRAASAKPKANRRVGSRARYVVGASNMRSVRSPRG